MRWLSIMPVFALACAVAQAADNSDFRLALEVMDARSKEQVSLGKALTAKHDHTIPDHWSYSSLPHSEVIKGQGYDAAIVWIAREDTRLTGTFYVSVPNGNIRYSLGPIQWLEMTDDVGQNVLKRNPTADTFAKHKAKLGVSSGPGAAPETHDMLINFEIRLADNKATKFRNLVGYAYLLCATRWDTLELAEFSPDGETYVFGDAKLTAKVSPMGNAKSGYPVLLKAQEGFAPIPFIHGRDPELLASEVTREGKTVRHLCDLSARDQGDWSFLIKGAVDPKSTIKLKILSEVAIVRVPFEFKNVPIPTAEEIRQAHEKRSRTVKRVAPPATTPP